MIALIQEAASFDCRNFAAFCTKYSHIWIRKRCGATFPIGSGCRLSIYCLTDTSPFALSFILFNNRWSSTAWRDWAISTLTLFGLACYRHFQVVRCFVELDRATTAPILRSSTTFDLLIESLWDLPWCTGKLLGPQINISIIQRDFLLVVCKHLHRCRALMLNHSVVVLSIII